jgi:MoaA/NifB/PqqE/SkfB family radical SAM enzyme
VRHIELSNWGEIFLNPQLGEIIEYAYAKNVTLTAGNGANLNTLSDEMAERLVKYNFSQVTVSIDGASSDIYRIYRIGGDFDAVINNIKKINYYKQKYKKGLPSLLWQFIVFGHNEHQLPMARKMAKELNMEFSPKGNTSPPYSPIKDEDFVKREAGLASWSEKETMYQMDRFCAQLYYSPQVNWDGELLGCCVAIKGSFGNVFKAGLISCLKSKKYIYAKEMLLGRRPAIQGIPCSDCPVYLNSRHTLRDNRLFKTLRLVDIYFANKYIKNLDNISR